MSKVNTPVAKTAIDAINAKLSALQSRYKLISDEECATGRLKNRHGELYEKLLRKINPSESGIKRQTPLVNAGYAIRVATLSSTVAKFLEQKSTTSSAPGCGINVVLLGCGLDVMGIWASSLVPNVNVYEIDCIDNCLLKSKRIKEIGIIKHDLKDETFGHHNDDDDGDCFILRGMIDLSNMYGKDEETSESFEQGGTYSLLAADLRDVPSLSKAMDASSFNPSLPTIAISELVIAYLGDDSKQLMKYISSSICTCNDSMFIAYEPVFPSNGDVKSGETASNCSSVIQNYGMDYFAQFSSKLNRGEAVQEHGDQATRTSSQPCFKPLGKSEIDVENKLRSCHFDGMIDCTQIATAVTYFDISRSTPPELFDEYAALHLHLYCYSIICATSSMFQLEDLVQICPWVKMDTVARGRGYHWKRKISTKNGGEVTLTSIKKEYQEQVQNIFKATYSQLFEEYPSVKKLVKSALKSDLSIKDVMASNNGGRQSDCAIWNRYSDNGGAFWVAIDETREDDSILGCIGVMKKDARHSMHGVEASHYYEINRLAVRAESRGMGIGKLLLDTVEDYVLQNTLAYPVPLVAVTPKILEAANLLYSTNEFTMKEEKNVGKMIIRTYVKTYLNSR